MGEEMRWRAAATGFEVAELEDLSKVEEDTPAAGCSKQPLDREATCHTFLKDLHEHTPDMPMYAVAWFLDFISPSYVSASAFEPAQHEETWPSFGCPELEET